jgi:hypothetical protein
VVFERPHLQASYERRATVACDDGAAWYLESFFTVADAAPERRGKERGWEEKEREKKGRGELEVRCKFLTMGRGNSKNE